MKDTILEIVCVRCGITNDVTLELIPEDDFTIYKCIYCKFILVRAFLGEEDDKD